MSTRPCIFALFLSVIVSIGFACATTRPPTWRKAPGGEDVRWCEGRGQHVTYTIDTCVPYYRVPAIRQAFEFWNGVLGRQLFVQADVGQIVVSCAGVAERGDRWAHIDGNFAPDGCEAVALIQAVSSLDSGENSFWVEVFKHEIGHSLGLLDNPASIVMAPSFVEWPLDGRGLTDVERAEITKRYLLP